MKSTKWIKVSIVLAVALGGVILINITPLMWPISGVIGFVIGAGCFYLWHKYMFDEDEGDDDNEGGDE